MLDSKIDPDEIEYYPEEWEDLSEEEIEQLLENAAIERELSKYGY